MNQATIANAKVNLTERKTDLETRLAQMQREIRSIGIEQGDEGGGLSNHFADDASSMAEGERLSSIGADLGDLLAQVNAALNRIEAGTFGICQRCGQPIGAERLEAFPYVAYCITCQGIIEREMALRAGR